MEMELNVQSLALNILQHFNLGIFIALELEKHDFKEWFEHIEHSFRHTIVPVGEEQTTTERYETPPTSIKYR